VLNKKLISLVSFKLIFFENKHKFLLLLVYIHDATIEDLEIPFTIDHMIDNIDFLVNDTRNSIDIATAFIFSSDECYENQFEVVNRFTSHRWESSKFFVEKFNNFYGCPLNNYIEYPQFKEALNYESQTYEWNENITGTYKEIMFYQGLNTHKMNQSNFYVTNINSLHIYTPPGEVYGDYEKMFLPFDTSTWIAIGITIVVAIAAILIIKIKPPEIQKIFFGSNNRSPLMNFVDILLNGGQNTNLIENAPRVFLMTFFFWSLIFRQVI
jgi:hypothetical protein